ncbi:hypothetical protein AB0F20_05605 [Streptomyces goshikiensis]|uniref:hypothetical protein n=1 Tax=Streptomyces goshikiensis TaxID=1942 RepID=UPI00340C344B
MTVRPLAIGDVIHGFAYEAFGRDHYHCVRIQAVGPDWIVARGGDQWHGPSFTSGQHALQLCQQARDEPCPQDDPCPLGVPAPPLTTYGVTS